jgi:hypothetical protein
MIDNVFQNQNPQQLLQQLAKNLGGIDGIDPISTLMGPGLGLSQNQAISAMKGDFSFLDKKMYKTMPLSFDKIYSNHGKTFNRQLISSFYDNAKLEETSKNSEGEPDKELYANEFNKWVDKIFSLECEQYSLSEVPEAKLVDMIYQNELYTLVKLEDLRIIKYLGNELDVNI